MDHINHRKETMTVMRTMITVVLGIVMTAAVALAAGYKNILSGDAKRLLASTKNVFLLDVRTPEEFRQARLQGAVLIPINEVERRLGEVPKNRPVLVYCAVGSRSNLVADYLAQRGYPQVYNLADGIVGWYRNGFPIIR